MDIVTAQQFQDDIFANFPVIHVVRDRIYAAISTIPETEAWLQTARLLILFTLIAYLQSGSLWTPVVIHWLAVVVWLLFLGGYRKLYAVVQK